MGQQGALVIMRHSLQTYLMTQKNLLEQRVKEKVFGPIGFGFSAQNLFLVRYLSLLVGAIALSYPCFAKVYDWVPLHSDDIQMISNPNVEAEYRIELAKRAKSTLDIVIFDQRVDDGLGKPFLRAIKQAADRGVKVRYMTAWVGMALRDPMNRTKNFLVRPLPLFPIDYHSIGGTEMWKKGWGYLDGIHEKLFIVDNQWVLITGRGHASDYLKWLDTCFLMKGKLVEQAQEAYDQLWNTAERETGRNQTDTPKESSLSDKQSQEISQRLRAGAPIADVTKDPPVILSQSDLLDLSRLLIWTDQKSIDPNQDERMGDVYSARLLHHDLLDQMRAVVDEKGGSPSKYDWNWRVENLYDPIVEELIKLSQEAKDFRYYSLSTNLNPKLKKALLHQLRNGLALKIFTNSKLAHTWIVPMKIPMGWYAGLSDLDDLLSEGAVAYGLIPSDINSSLFLHRKVAVIDDTVIFGSHNFNFASTVESDEMSIEVRGVKFADQVRKLFDDDAKNKGEPLDPLVIHQDRVRSGFHRWLSQYFSGLY